MEAGSTKIQLAQKATYSVIAYFGRDLPKAYRNMLLSKWLRSLRFGNDFFRLIDGNSYFSAYQKHIENILSRAQCVVRLAVLTDEIDTCLGFSVSEPDVLHYVWSHKDNRRIGIAKTLLNFPFHFITHLTTNGISLWQKKFPKVKFDPFQ